MQRITSILLSILIISLSAGVTINTHFCGGNLESVSFYQDKDCCCGDGEMESNCCSNETIQYQTDQQFAPVSFEWKVKVFKTVAAAVQTEIVSFQLLSHKAYQNYKPPLLQRNIPVLVQSFLL
jgi:hypothetical protein